LPPEYINQEAAPAQDAVVTVGQSDIDSLINAAKAAGVDAAYICQKAQIQNIEQLPLARFAGAMAHLQKLAQGKTE
jgi:electron transfer flavoprotein alpha/beta subunit